MESLRDYNELHGHFSDPVRASAEIIAPILLELTGAKSVVDVGCGSGIWLKAFAGRGLAIHGLDGDYIDRASLLIPHEAFQGADLTKPFTATPADLAICLEVAEHLPESSADTFIDGLVRAAPAVFFSAAIPGQGGMGHVNEQWPSFWKGKFEARGYRAFDAVRRRVWRKGVLYWYAQNPLLYVRQTELGRYPLLAGEPLDFAVDVIHPDRYVVLDGAARAGEHPSVAFLAKSFPGALARFVKARLGQPLNLREPSHKTP
jgi:SAM-dependent methyltransferase